MNDGAPLLLRYQPWTQLSLLLAAVGVLIVGGALGAQVIAPLPLAGFTIILVGAIMVVLLNRMRPAAHTEWIALVPLSSLVGIALIRDAAVGVVDGIGFMMVFPLAWLGAAFPIVPTIVGVILAAMMPLASAIRAGRMPPTGPEWVAFGVFFAFAALMALSAFAVGHQLRREARQRQAAAAASEESLRAREEALAILQAVSEATDDAVVVFDPEGRVLSANSSARRLGRLAGVDLTAKPTFRGHRIYSADRRTPLVFPPDPVADMVARGAVYERIAWIGDTDQVAVSYVAQPVFHDGYPLGSVLIAHDVTDLVEAIEVRDRFLDAVSHELRTPLTVLMGETELAQMEDTSPRVAARLERVDEAAQRLFTTVEHLLSAHRQHVQAMPDTTSVALAVGDVVDREASLAREHEVTVRFTDHGAGNARVDARSLGTMVDELLRNAVLYSPRGATIAVDTRRDAGAAVVEIVDAGVGMTDSERRRAFDRFYRTDFAREQAVPGVGLGLSIAHTLAEGTGVTIELEPGPQGGTCARLRLPPAIAAG